MSWYNATGPMQTHVLYTKVRYVRNVKDLSFYHLADQKRADELFTKLNSILEGNGFRGEKITDSASPYLFSLAEKELIECDVVYSERPRALYFNDPCNLTVSLGGDDYISISSVVSGLAANEAINMASGAEELIDREIAFAYSESIGYLSPNVTKCGSGTTFSAALYLPSLRLLGEFARKILSLSSLSMSLSPRMCDEKNAGDVYILTYSPHYLSDESRAAELFSATVTRLIKNEEIMLSTLFKDKKQSIYDKAKRALGTLLYADTLDESEMLSLLSDIRLYHSIDKCAPPHLPKINDLNYFCAEGLNSSILHSAKDKCTSMEDCDRARAELIRKYLKDKAEVS